MMMMMMMMCLSMSAKEYKPVFDQTMLMAIDEMLAAVEKPIQQPRLGPLSPPNWRSLSGTSRCGSCSVSLISLTYSDLLIGYEIKLLVSQYLDPIFQLVWSQHRNLVHGKPLWDTYLRLYRLVFSHEISPDDLDKLPNMAAELEQQVRKLNPKQKITYLFHQTHHIAEAIRHLGMSPSHNARA